MRDQQFIEIERPVQITSAGKGNPAGTGHWYTGTRRCLRASHGSGAVVSDLGSMVPPFCSSFVLFIGNVKLYCYDH
jgi:hypothetical protein